MTRSTEDRERWTELEPARRSILRHAGFGPELSAEIACDRRYDVTSIRGLVDRGCPPLLALRIVAPIREKRRA